ncbi:unknown [Clostridium sp. CAG:448]|nr:unknown [Clostridium sp. CAG:448]
MKMQPQEIKMQKRKDLSTNRMKTNTFVNNIRRNMNILQKLTL